jgi:hypothetical protein
VCLGNAPPLFAKIAAGITDNTVTIFAAIIRLDLVMLCTPLMA